jgi:hypothetical protein
LLSEFPPPLNLLALLSTVILQDQIALSGHQFLQTEIQAVKHFLLCLIRRWIAAGGDDCGVEIRIIRVHLGTYEAKLLLKHKLRHDIAAMGRSRVGDGSFFLKPACNPAQGLIGRTIGCDAVLVVKMQCLWSK